MMPWTQKLQIASCMKLELDQALSFVAVSGIMRQGHEWSMSTLLESIPAFELIRLEAQMMAFIISAC